MGGTKASRLIYGPNDIYVYIWPKLAPWGSKNMFKSTYTCLGSIWGHLRKIDFFDFLDYEKNFFWHIYIYKKCSIWVFYRFFGFLWGLAHQNPLNLHWRSITRNNYVGPPLFVYRCQFSQNAIKSLIYRLLN